ncbi:type II secretion system protein GspC [Colwellia sp. D2M02]|uniref:Type II secretion system protein GspC n=1 Tax=Colwellia asteriadis TaxID=517723 RepID=A0ABN1L3H3_9GAMM|nr:type II secretion system protein GspC [Colwellia sp. D2M02]MBU2891739.1 type II secretion system protein GspC [Colwellia sp. D2M02]
MQFPTNITAFTVFTFLKATKTQRKVAQICLLILVTYIAYLSAQITWFSLPNTTSSSVTVPPKTSFKGQASEQDFDLSPLQQLHLFGQYNKTEEKVEVVAVQDAPQTRLNLTLSGLVASDNPENAAAIIQYQGKQETYGIDELIKGTRASLAQVLMDRVLIKHAGKLETLMLDGFDYKEPARTISRRDDITAENSVVDNRSNANLIATAQELRDEISQDPSSISDYLNIQPVMKEGEIIGYSLRAGKSPEFFQQAGLKSGDVALQMNGYDLTAPDEAMQALAEMKEATDISLLIDRNGNTVEIIFSLN